MQLRQDNKNLQHNQRFPERHRLHSNVPVNSILSSFSPSKVFKSEVFEAQTIAQLSCELFKTRQNSNAAFPDHYLFFIIYLKVIVLNPQYGGIRKGYVWGTVLVDNFVFVNGR